MQALALAQACEDTGADVQEVARAVHEALTSPSPRARYVLPATAQLGVALRRLLPDAWWDALLLGALKAIAAGADSAKRRA